MSYSGTIDTDWFRHKLANIFSYSNPAQVLEELGGLVKSADKDFVLSHFNQLFPITIHKYFEMDRKYGKYKSGHLVSPHIDPQDSDDFMHYRNIYNMLGEDLHTYFESPFINTINKPIEPQTRPASKTSNGDCPICMQSMRGQHVLKCPGCHEQFHNECISPICYNHSRQPPKCPVCRKEWPEFCEGMPRDVFTGSRISAHGYGGRKRTNRLKLKYKNKSKVYRKKCKL